MQDVTPLPKPIDAVLFDLDGTLIDTAPTFENVLNQLLMKYQKKVLTTEAIRKQVSHGAGALITLGFGIEEKNNDHLLYKNELLDLYEKNIHQGSKLFPGMENLLSILEKNNIPWGIVTNKPKRFTLPLITALNLNDRCSVIVCPDDVTKTKPYPDPLLLACFRLNCKASHCIYVGDHERDIASGNAANMYTISALYGYIDSKELINNWQADNEINEPPELLSLLKLN